MNGSFSDKVSFKVIFFWKKNPQKTYKKTQGDLDDDREITSAWSYSRENQFEQLFFFLDILEGEIYSLSNIILSYWFTYYILIKKGQKLRKKSHYQ